MSIDTSSAAFFAVCGTIVGWIGFWAIVSKIVRDANRNALPGSRAKKAIDAINLIQILPLLPLVPLVVIWIVCVKKPIEILERQSKGRMEVVKLRRAWEGRRREWASDDLETARAEKEGLFKVVERPVEVGGSSKVPQVHSVEVSARPGQSRFEALPAELRLDIYRRLDYGVALRLKAVSRFLWNDMPEESLDREQRATFVYHADTFAHNRKAGRLACYTCLRLRSKGEFSDDRRTGNFKRFGSQETERRCFDCQVIKGEVTWTRRLGRGWNRLETRIWDRLRFKKSSQAG